MNLKASRPRIIQWSLIALAGAALAVGGWALGRSAEPQPGTPDPGEYLSVLNRPAGTEDFDHSGLDIDRVRYIGTGALASYYVGVDSSFSSYDELGVCLLVVDDPGLPPSGAAVACQRLSRFPSVGASLGRPRFPAESVYWLLPDGHADQASTAEWGELIGENVLEIYGDWGDFNELRRTRNLYTELGLEGDSSDFTGLAEDDHD